MRNDSANNTGEVSGSEGYTELSGFGICFFWLSENVCVEELYDLFEEEEFGHSIGNLLRIDDR